MKAEAVWYPKQKKFYRTANRRSNIAEGSIRSGKTFITIQKFIRLLADPPKGGEIVMVGKTNGSLYRNIIAPIEQMLGPTQCKYIIGRCVFKIWGLEIYCFGANDEGAKEKIQGLTVALALGDEVALWPESFFIMLLGRMSPTGATGLYTTNPDNPNHWLKKIIDDKELDQLVMKFLLEDNGSLDPAYVKNVKKEYKGVFYKRYILGLWIAAEGAIYDFFEKSLHVIPLDRKPKAQYYIAGSDYGTANPFFFGIFGVNERTIPKIWLETSYYYDSKKHRKQKTDDQYLAAIKKHLIRYHPDMRLRNIYLDPSAASFRTLLKSEGFPVKEADNDVMNGIETQSRLLANGTYKILDHPTNKECIDEYFAYSWDPKKSEQGIDAPIKRDDHCKDGERYVLHTCFGKYKVDYEKLNRMA